MTRGQASERARGSLAALIEGPWTPWILVAIALLARLWALHYQPWVTIDGTEYIRFAEALHRGQGFASIFPPGYPVLIALAKWFVPDRVMAAAAVSVIAGALLPWPAWLLARRAMPAKWAWLPGLAIALHPGLILASVITMSESAFLLALYGALALVAAKRSFLPGLALGAAFAIRPEALVTAAALAVRELRNVVRGALTPTVTALRVAGFMALAIPCWFYFHATLGSWTLTPKMGALRATTADWRRDEPRLDTQEEDAPSPGWDARIVTAVRQYPANALVHARSLAGQWPIPLLALALLGLARRRGIESVPLIQILMIPLLGLSGQPRFVWAAIPAMAILATHPIATLTKPRVRVGLVALWVIGAAWCGFKLGPELKLPFDFYEEAHKEAGDWLLHHSDAHDRVMDRKPILAFYARRPYWVMPDESYDRIIEYAIRKDVRYLVIDEGVAKIFRPQLLPLLFDPEFRDREQRLQMVYAGGHFKGYGIGLFRVLRPGEKKTDEPPHFAVRWMLDRAGSAPNGPHERP